MEDLGTYPSEEASLEVSLLQTALKLSPSKVTVEPPKQSFATAALSYFDQIASRNTSNGLSNSTFSFPHIKFLVLDRSAAASFLSSLVSTTRSKDVVAMPGVVIVGLSFCVTLIFIVLLWALMAEAHHHSKSLSDDAHLLTFQTFGSGSTASLPAFRPSISSTSKLEQMPTKSASQPASTKALVARPQAPALCQGLILPQAAAQFRILLESIERLRMGNGPVQVLGRHGRPLLHAWLQYYPSFSDAQGLSTGFWLQLTTTAESRHPHASVGPLPIGAATGSRNPIAIFGPKSSRYGALVADTDKWSVYHNDRNQTDSTLVLTLKAGSPLPGISVFSADGIQIASAMQIGPSSELPASAITLGVNAGSDALLALLSTLAVVLCLGEPASPGGSSRAERGSQSPNNTLYRGEVRL